MRKILIIRLILVLLTMNCQRAYAGENGVVGWQKLEHLIPDARRRVEGMLNIARNKWPSRRIVIAETYRSQTRHDEIYKKGSRFTTVRVSQHTRGLAADIYFVNKRGILEYDQAPYKSLGKIGEALGLTWGGRWKKPFDPGHFEYRGEQYAYRQS